MSHSTLYHQPVSTSTKKSFAFDRVKKLFAKKELNADIFTTISHPFMMFYFLFLVYLSFTNFARVWS